MKYKAVLLFVRSALGPAFLKLVAKRFADRACVGLLVAVAKYVRKKGLSKEIGVDELSLNRIISQFENNKLY